MEKMGFCLALNQSFLVTERFTCMLCYSIKNISLIVPARINNANLAFKKKKHKTKTQNQKHPKKPQP